MVSKNKGTPLTMEMFEEALLPRIEEIFVEKMEEHKVEVDRTIKGYRNEVVDFKVEVLGEIKNLREEVTVVNHQYERTNKRVDKISKHLNISA